MFLHRIQATPDRQAFTYPDGATWKALTWKQTGELTLAAAGALRSLGLTDEQRVSILCSTRYEWIIADLAISCAGLATTTIYPSSKEDECAYIITDSNTVLVIAENDGQVKKLQSKRAEMPAVKKVVVIDGKGTEDGWVMSWSQFLDDGRAWSKANPGKLEEIAKAVRPDQLCTLIYTSGTTGKPKGVELTHDCWVYEAEGMEALDLLHIDDVEYLWLPLAHSFGKVLEAGQLRVGWSAAVDGRVDKIVENLGVVKPTFVPAVPRIFEKVYNKVIQQTQEAGGLKWSIFQWAFGVGHEVSRLKQEKREPGALLALQNSIAHKLVFSKLHARFGGNLKLFVSGSAPLSKQIAEWFHAAGIPIYEGYGLTETSAFSFVNRPDSVKFGTVGLPVKGLEVKIAEDGEILMRGRGIMRGYHNLPTETAETLDKDGWLHTGDIGELDEMGRLKITDRKKDLIKTSGGKYVAPGALESRFKSLCPYASQLVVHGDNRNFVSALIAFDEESLRKWAGTNGVSGTYAEMSKNPKVIALFQGFVDTLNKELPSYSTVKKFALLEKDLNEADGDLTPSQKLKRKAVEKKYKALLDTFYVGAVAGAD
ncbi:MAG: long-chain fatty acid--CoA ligase [Deltaproteobacteria bacterium]|nr:long-chain fatty acid--CoA ligase [Deltaproteobacteria bacterium]